MRCQTLPRGLALLLVLALLLGQGLESFHQHEDEVPVGFAWAASDCHGHPASAHVEHNEPAPEVCFGCTMLAQASTPTNAPLVLQAYACGVPTPAPPSAPPVADVESVSRGRAPPTSC